MDDKERLTEVNAQLVRIDTKAIGITQVAGVMLAIGATRDDMTIAVWAWSLSLGFALLALYPVLRGDHGIVAWSKGRAGAAEPDAVQRLSAFAIGKYRFLQIAILCLFVSPVAVLWPF